MGGKKNNATTDQQIAGIQVQTSIYGQPIPLVYGTTRLTGNLIFAPPSGFVATPHTTTQSSGKGGGSSSSNTTYTYNAFVMVVLCEGTIGSINQVWSAGALGSLSGYGFTFTATGTRPQTPWATLTSHYSTQAAPYSGMACVAAASLPLTNSAAIPNFSFETVALFATQQDPNALSAYDALPSDIIADFLTNTYYGVPGLTSSMLDVTGMTTGAASYKTYCQACAFTLSPSFDSQKNASNHLQDILDATNSELIGHSTATGMVLQVIPYGDVAITANGATYTPNTTPIYNLGYDDFITNGPTDPVKITRDSTQDVFNCVPVEYLDRLSAYNTNVLQMPDPVDVALNGMKVDSAKTLHAICRAAHASNLSLILSQRNVYIRNGYQFNLGLKMMLLEPMDLVNLNELIIGFVNKTVRIAAIDIPGEDSEAQGMTFTCEEWPFGVANAALYTPQTPAGTSPNVNVDPGACSAPLFFASPALFANSRYEVCIFIGGGANWGSGDVYMSTAGSTYAKAGSVTAPARYGTLTASLAAYAGGTAQDNTNTLSVVLVNGGVLSSIDNASASNGMNILWVDGEMISYQTATLTSPGNYNLTGLYRGLYGTSPGSHISGASWGRCDTAMLRYALTPLQVGVLFYAKVLSFNLWGGGGRTLSGETPYSYTPAPQALPVPTSVTLAFTLSKPA